MSKLSTLVFVLVLSTNVGAIDSISRHCLQCHSGEIGQDIAINSKMSGAFASHGRGEHAVGIAYSQVYRQQPQIYHPTHRVAAKLPLFNGRISCISCHQQKTAKPISTDSFLSGLKPVCTSSDKLTVGTKQSDLCMTCHNM